MAPRPRVLPALASVVVCAAAFLASSSPVRAASIPLRAHVRILPAHGDPVEVLAGNLDGDTRIDVVAVNFNTSDLSPFVGNGDGTFRVRPHVTTSNFPKAASRGDLDEDGYDDWVVCGGTPTLVIHRGGPTGPSAAVSLADPVGAVSCLVTRVDDDAHLDLVIVRAPNVLSVRLGNGDGTFRAPVDYAAGTDVKGVAGGDLNGDGHTDLVVGHSSGSTVAVFYGHANGSLDPAASVSLSSSPSEVAIADLNADGRLDLVAGSTGASLLVRLGNPAGGFLPLASFPTEGPVKSLAIADVNGDERPDALVTATSFAVMIGDGTGGFLPSSSTPIGPEPGRLCVADFDGDGVPDVAAIAGLEFPESPIAILIGVGDGTFPPQRVVSPGGGVVRGIQIGDTNGDGHADLVLGTNAGELFTLLGDGHGSFPDRRTGIAFTHGWLRLGDFDEDGTPDLVDADAAGFAIRHGAGDGTFTTSPYFASGPIVGNVDLGDEQPDGHLDVVSPTNGGGMVHLGSGDGTVGTGVAVSSYALSHQTESVHFADMNGDGRDDLVFSMTAGRPTVVLVGFGPSYPPGIPFADSYTVRDLDSGDFDRDGKRDIVTAYPGEESGALWKGGGNGSFSLLGSYSDGSSPDVRTGRFNADDSLDFAVFDPSMGTVAIRAGHGDGTFADREDFGAGGSASVMQPGDLDGDSVQDLAVGLQNGDVALLLSNGAPRLPILSHLVARVQGPVNQIACVATEPSRWTQFAVERASAGDGGWQRLPIATTTLGDTTFAVDDSPPAGSVWYRIAARTSDGQWIGSGPVPARDGLVPALVSLQSFRVDAGRVRLRWIDAAGELATAEVERSDDGTSWRKRASVQPDGSGLLEYVDDDVRPGARYGYRLAFLEDGATVRRGEAWVDVPGNGRIRLSAPSPQSATSGLDLSWELPRAGDALIRLFDLAGREVASQRVRAGDSALRRERIATRHELAPGVYLARLESGGEGTSVRVIVLR